MGGVSARYPDAVHLSAGVHHPDFLAHDNALAAGMLLFLALELNGTPARLVLLRFLLGLRLQAFLDDAEVFEVGEFHLQEAKLLFFGEKCVSLTFVLR